MIRRSILGTLALLIALPVWAGEKNSPITKDQADAILSELKEIHQLLARNLAALQAPPPAAPTARPQDAPVQAKLKIEGGYMLGAANAPITMIEYSDSQCPFCQRYHSTSFAEIKKNYIDTGKVRYISRDLPLAFHANAMLAAAASRCAGEENLYWEMRDTLVKNASKLSQEDILGYADALHLNASQFKACLTSGKYKSSIEKEAAEARSLKIGGTPGFVIGRTTAEGVDGEVVIGALPYEAFEGLFREIQSAKPAM